MTAAYFGRGLRRTGLRVGDAPPSEPTVTSPKGMLVVAGLTTGFRFCLRLGAELGSAPFHLRGSLRLATRPRARRARGALPAGVRPLAAPGPGMGAGRSGHRQPEVTTNIAEDHDDAPTAAGLPVIETPTGAVESRVNYSTVPCPSRLSAAGYELSQFRHSGQLWHGGKAAVGGICGVNNSPLAEPPLLGACDYLGTPCMC